MSEDEEQVRFLVKEIVRVGQAFQVATLFIGAVGGWAVSRSRQPVIIAILAGAVAIGASGYLVASFGRMRTLGFRNENGGDVAAIER